MFQHFSEHQQEDQKITFLQFLDMHYMHGSPKDKDYDRDMQLPFKTSSDCVMSVTPVTVPELGTTILSPQGFILKNDFFTVNDSFVAAAFRCNIFQPPRI
ncbi:MAG: hypothetical protein ABI687_13340 [Flavitalea sp.]